jgi:hypothetical protein
MANWSAANVMNKELKADDKNVLKTITFFKLQALFLSNF